MVVIASVLWLYNVVSWSIARFAIVPNKIQIIQGPINVWKVHYCGKKSWETSFCWKKMFEWKKNDVFWKKSCLSAVPKKKSDRLLNPY